MSFEDRKIGPPLAVNFRSCHVVEINSKLRNVMEEKTKARAAQNEPGRNWKVKLTEHASRMDKSKDPASLGKLKETVN